MAQNLISMDWKDISKLQCPPKKIKQNIDLTFAFPATPLSKGLNFGDAINTLDNWKNVLWNQI